MVDDTLYWTNTNEVFDDDHLHIHSFPEQSARDHEQGYETTMTLTTLPLTLSTPYLDVQWLGAQLFV